MTGDNGFSGTVTDGDTLVTDPSLEPGAIVAYEAVHFDIHGNASDIAALVLEAPARRGPHPAQRGLEPRFQRPHPGRRTSSRSWPTSRLATSSTSLPSTRACSSTTRTDSFLNTLSSWNTGYGHWIKVASDDTLRVAGGRLAEDHMPGLAEGWYRRLRRQGHRA